MGRDEAAPHYLTCFLRASQHGRREALPRSSSPLPAPDPAPAHEAAAQAPDAAPAHSAPTRAVPAPPAGTRCSPRPSAETRSQRHRCFRAESRRCGCQLHFVVGVRRGRPRLLRGRVANFVAFGLGSLAKTVRRRRKPARCRGRLSVARERTEMPVSGLVCPPLSPAWRRLPRSPGLHGGGRLVLPAPLCLRRGALAEDGGSAGWAGSFPTFACLGAGRPAPVCGRHVVGGGLGRAVRWRRGAEPRAAEAVFAWVLECAWVTLVRNGVRSRERGGRSALVGWRAVSSVVWWSLRSGGKLAVSPLVVLSGRAGGVGRPAVVCRSCAPGVGRPGSRWNALIPPSVGAGGEALRLCNVLPKLGVCVRSLSERKVARPPPNCVSLPLAGLGVPRSALGPGTQRPGCHSCVSVASSLAVCSGRLWQLDRLTSFTEM